MFLQGWERLWSDVLHLYLLNVSQILDCIKGIIVFFGSRILWRDLKNPSYEMQRHNESKQYYPCIVVNLNVFVSNCCFYHFLERLSVLGFTFNSLSLAFCCCRATHSYAIFYISLGVFVPLVVVLFCYASIFVRYWQVKRDIRSRRVVSMELRSNASVSAASPVGAAPDQSRLQVPLISSGKTGSRSPNGEGSVFPSDLSSATMSNYVSAGSSAQLQQGGGTSKKGFTSDDIKLAKTLFTVFIVFLVCWQVKAVFRCYFTSYYWLTDN